MRAFTSPVTTALLAKLGGDFPAQALPSLTRTSLDSTHLGLEARPRQGRVLPPRVILHDRSGRKRRHGRIESSTAMFCITRFATEEVADGQDPGATNVSAFL
jgi:hypothetical protein